MCTDMHWEGMMYRVPDSSLWCPLTRGNGHKLKNIKICLNTRKTFLERGWSNMGMGFSDCGDIKTLTFTVLGSQIYVTWLEQVCWTRRSQEVPASANNSVIATSLPQGCFSLENNFYHALHMFPLRTLSLAIPAVA